VHVLPWIGAAVASVTMLSASVAGAQGAIQTPPKPGVTKGEAIRAFVDSVVLGCVASRDDTGRIADLQKDLLDHFQPAAAIDRKWSHVKDAATPVWTTPVMGGLITIAEPSPDRCEVTGMQLPVDETFKLVMVGAKAIHPDFVDQPIKPGYDPIAYQLERTFNGMRYIVHLEGSEPGGLGHPDRMLAGHAFRFSLLMAVVIRQPESAKPPYR
jgi:hypothetical protein